MRNLRYRLGISQAVLAERANMHQTFIARVERGDRNVTLNSIEKLAYALQTSTSALLKISAGTGREKLVRAVPSRAESVDILMVEDNRDDVELTLRAFRQARITNTVRVVHDGQEALDYLFCTGRFAYRPKKLRPLLVLLDLNLPKVGGLEVLRRIKADPRLKSIPVVVLTASRDSQVLAQCRQLGAETSIVKPVDFQNLSQATPGIKLDWMLVQSKKQKSVGPAGVLRQERRTS